MKKSQKDPGREDRIYNDIIVDANGPEEQAMGWYYYLDDKILSGRAKASKFSVWLLKMFAPPKC
jgi:hypothetical protein